MTNPGKIVSYIVCWLVLYLSLTFALACLVITWGRALP